MGKLWAMIVKDIYLTFTDRVALLFNIAAPLAISLIVGVAFGGLGGSSDISIPAITVIVVNEDQGAELPTGDMLNLGQQLADFLISPPDETLQKLLNARAGDDWEAARALVEAEDSKVTAAVYIPADFSAKASVQQKGLNMELGQGEIQLYHKSAWAISSSVIESILAGWANRISTGSITTQVGIEQIVQQMGVQSVAAIQELVGNLEEAYSAQPIALEVQDAGGKRQEVSVISIIAPSMAIFFLSFGMTLGAGELLTERQNWTLQRMFITPTPRAVILGGKMAAVYLSGVMQLFILLVITSLIGASWGGNWSAVVLLVLAVVAAATGVGAFIASLVDKPQQLGVYGVAILMVMGVLSGSFTNTRFLGDYQILSMLTPNWWGIEGFTTLAQGGGLPDILTHLVVLLLMGVVFFTIGVWRFRRKLDF